MDSAVELRNLGGTSRLRAAIHIPPLLFVSGLILFWAFFMAFGAKFNMPIMAGDPKDVIPRFLMAIGYLLFAGTILNLVAYPALCFFLKVFKRSLAPSNFYAWAIWILSGCSLVFFGPKIYWFLD